jgi:hypothetical protein
VLICAALIWVAILVGFGADLIRKAAALRRLTGH